MKSITLLSLHKHLVTATIGSYAILYIHKHKNNLTNNPMNKKGFTLIELLVVIVIIGILATAGFSAFTSAQKKARDGIRTSDIGQIKATLQADRLEEGNYNYADAAAIQAIIEGDMEGKVPGDPQATNYYILCVSGEDMWVGATSEVDPAAPLYVGTAGGITDAEAATNSFSTPSTDSGYACYSFDGTAVAAI